MKKKLLTMVTLASLTAIITLVHADDMGMGATTPTNGMMDGMSGSASSTNCYSARGLVEKIAPDWQTVTIHHEAISGNMPEMTMNFAVQNTNELNGISVGDQVTFTLVVANNNEWIQNIKPTGQKAPVMTNSAPSMDMSQTNQ